MEELVFVDLETGGLEPETRPVIQIAAIAVESSSLRELQTIELKIKFNKKHVSPNALNKNSYDPVVWEQEALKPKDAANQFASFLRIHSTIDMTSSQRSPYQIAQLVAHNAPFDGPFIHTWYRKLGIFCPARYQLLCTLQRALWYFDEHKTETPPANFQLGTLCQYFGVPFRDEHAHDALADIRATASLYRAITRADRRTDVP